MADLNYKLGDLYDGYSVLSTREMSLPDGADLEKLPANDTNEKTAGVTEVTTSNASKGSILLAVGIIGGIAILFGVLKG